ncbi:MAG: hypothetical protein ACREFE_11945, partial [Limisphaerales bacterium]
IWESKKAKGKIKKVSGIGDFTIGTFAFQDWFVQKYYKTCGIGTRGGLKFKKQIFLAVSLEFSENDP